MPNATYDYEELAYDLYEASSELLDGLVAMRKQRRMTQQQLAEEMNVSQSYISKIENGQAELTTILTDYALEVGVRIDYHLEPAEKKPNGKRNFVITHATFDEPVFDASHAGDVSVRIMKIDVTTSLPSSGKSERANTSSISLAKSKQTGSWNVTIKDPKREKELADARQ
ncbi:hypothetical protein KIM372_04490 [Bombiscardovia nodaiensis]|uniref:HTH cro/C1-type domain-containing protein n=1 Tax=Bombiscardovia nodaiensis TaxID=2932181 RepID=A0ABM8B6S7_9BIFI|nr:hypothetical protein KIM372_04490 [Bombiscardovia nodaiensis]